MAYPFNEDHEMIREAARGWLLDWHDGGKALERVSVSGVGVDLDAWAKFAGEQGFAGIAIEEAYGGAGLGALGRSVVMEEMGYALFSSPFFSTCCLAADLLTHFASEAVKKVYLPKIAAGEISVGVAYEGLSKYNETITGLSPYVLDAGHCDYVLACVASDNKFELYLVPSSHEGLVVTQLNTLDRSRNLCGVEFNQLALKDADYCGASDVVLFDQVLRIAQASLASEAIGGAQKCLDLVLDYADQRVQFGRKISSYQAIKHRCADIFVDLQTSRSSAYMAANIADTSSLGQAHEAALIAIAWANDMYFKTAGETIQLHGGIGFTWDYPLHYYFKRARANRTLFITPQQAYIQLASVIGLDTGINIEAQSHGASQLVGGQI